MKILACAICVLSFCLFVDAGYEKFSGHAKACTPGRGFKVVEAQRDVNPSEFQGIMSYQWIRATLIGAAGLFMLGVIRRADSLDPLEPK